MQSGSECAIYIYRRVTRSARAVKQTVTFVALRHAPRWAAAWALMLLVSNLDAPSGQRFVHYARADGADVWQPHGG